MFVSDHIIILFVTSHFSYKTPYKTQKQVPRGFGAQGWFGDFGLV